MSKKYRAVCVFVAVLGLAFAAAQTLYSGLRLIAPQKTSRSYQDLRAGRLKVSAVVIAPQNAAQPLDMHAHLEAMRREALSAELEMERSRGRHGLVLWGSILIAGGLILGFATWRRL